MTRTRGDCLAIDGGPPVRTSFLPVARPHVSEAAIAEVVEVLRSGWLTTGPRTLRFEEAFASRVGCAHGVGVTSGTAAIRLGLELAGIGAGDEVLTTPMTYVAAAHELLHVGATPVFVDIDPRTLNLDPRRVVERITPRSRALLLMHFAGRPCDMTRLAALAAEHGLHLLNDGAHSIEAQHAGRPLARWFPLNAFSFHPVKNMTTGEGGMLCTDDAENAARARLLRLHGVARDAWQRHGGAGAAHADDVVMLGHKCNMSDLQASLGLHQLNELDARLARREVLWARYDRGLQGLAGISGPTAVPPGERHARHLYTVLVDPDESGLSRDELRGALRAENIGTGYHYRSLHRTTFYRQRLALDDAELPHASSVSERIVSLPLFPEMLDADVDSVIEALQRVASRHR